MFPYTYTPELLLENMSSLYIIGWYNNGMELVLSDNVKMVVRFDPGEEIFSGLTQFAKTIGINAAFVSGLGSAKEVELGFFDPKTREFQKTVFSEPVEILSIEGNMGILDTEAIVHIHGTFGLQNFQVIGGHIHRLVVGATVELMIDTMGGELHKAYDEESGLNLMKQ